MNILIVTPSISRAGGGVSEAVRLLTKALSGSHHIEVMTFRDEAFDQDIDKWSHVRVTAFSFIGPANYCFSPRLVAALRLRNPDVVHIHGLWMFHCLAVQAVFGGKNKPPIVLTPHGMLEKWILNRSRMLKALVSFLYQNRFLRRVDLFHALTAKEVGDVSAILSTAHSLILPNFVEAPLLQKSGSADWCDSRFDGKKKFLFLGRIHEKKGCLELLAAWRRLCQEDEDFSAKHALIFAGWIDSLPDFQSEIKRAKDEGASVYYVGAQYDQEKWQSLNSADFFVLPSKSEGLPMAVLEAWALGVPVLMTAACNLPDGFKIGAAIEIGTNEASLIEDLRGATKISPSQYEQMSRSAKELASVKYSLDAFKGSIENAYKSLITKNYDSGK